MDIHVWTCYGFSIQERAFPIPKLNEILSILYHQLPPDSSPEIVNLFIDSIKNELKKKHVTNEFSA